MVFKHSLERFYDIIGNSRYFDGACLEHLVDTSMNICINMYTFLSTARPSFVTWRKCGWYDLPLCVILSISVVPGLSQWWHNLFMVKNIEINLWLLKWCRVVLIVEKALVEFSILVKIEQLNGISQASLILLNYDFRHKNLDGTKRERRNNPLLLSFLSFLLF